MKKKVLISSIIRNRAPMLGRYFSQIEAFIEALKDKYEFSITIYENDSEDGSDEIIRNYDYSSFKESFIKTEKLGKPYFGSVTDAERVVNFAEARNKTLEGVNINNYDWLLIIEPDIVYSTEIISAIIDRTGLPYDPDIYSGVLMMNNVPYDIWGMRRTPHEEWGWFFDDWSTNPVVLFWTTANGVCLYSTEPFKKGLKFSAFNKRLNKYDCDTAVLCEDFREMGFNKIIVNQKIQPIHER